MIRLFTLVYGAKHIDLFKRCLVASLGWSKNKSALSRVSHWDIYTSKQEIESVRTASSDLGLQLEFHAIDTNQDAGKLLQESIICQMDICISSGNSMFIAPPDSVFGNGSMGSIIDLSDGGLCISVPHARSKTKETLAELKGREWSNAQLVGLAWKNIHPSWRDADVTLQETNTYWGGVSWRRIDDGLYAVTHQLPTVYLAKPTKDDVDWFRSQERLGGWDHRWPELLVNQKRHRMVCSSDIAFVVELTDENENIPPCIDRNVHGATTYRGDMAHHVVNQNSICLFRAAD